MVENCNELLKKHGTIRAAAKSIGVAESTFRGWLNKSKSNSKSNKTTVKNVKKSIVDFKKKFDKSYIIPLRIKEGLSNLGSLYWEYETDFSRSIGVSLSDLSAYRDSFSDHIVQLKEGRRIWAGSKKVASKMREML